MVTLFLYLVNTGHLVLASNMSQFSGDMALFYAINNEVV